MKALFTSIMSKLSGSALDTSVGSRIYFGDAPEGTTFPYVVFSVVSGYEEDTFRERVDETIIQFSLYSISKGVTEIGTMYDNLRALFDAAVFSVSGGVLVRCMFQNMTTLYEDITTSAGTVGLKHWPVDYVMTVKKN